MTDKEKIREVIENRYEYWKEKEFNSHSIESEIRISECKHLLLIVNSLPKESASEDLENEIDRFAKTVVPSRSKTITKSNLSLCAKHFAEWQREKDIKLKKIDDLEEPASDDLEEEITKCYKSRNDLMMTRKQFGKLIHHFTDWQHGKDFDDLLQSEMKFPKEYYEKGKADMREEMMKDALDGCVSLIVKSDPNSRNLFISTPQLYKELQKYNDGDKLKIIIVKTEQQ